MHEHVKTVIKYMPAHHDIIREAIIVMAGAMLAAFVVRQLPPKYQQMFSMPISNQGSNTP